MKSASSLLLRPRPPPPTQGVLIYWNRRLIRAFEGFGQQHPSRLFKTPGVVGVVQVSAPYLDVESTKQGFQPNKAYAAFSRARCLRLPRPRSAPRLCCHHFPHLSYRTTTLHRRTSVI